MHRVTQFLLAAAGMAFCAGAALAELPKVSHQDIELFASSRAGHSDQLGEPLASWQSDARAALKTQSVARAAHKLASRYHLDEQDSRDLLDLWLLSGSLRYSYPDGSYDQVLKDLHSAFVRVVRHSGYSDLVVEAAAVSGSAFDRCEAADFEDLSGGAPDRFAVEGLLSASARCAEWDIAFLAHFPDRSLLPLLSLARYGGVDPSIHFALLEYTAGSEALAHVAPADRAAAQARLIYSAAIKLWDKGLFAEGIGLFEGAPDAVKSLLLDTDLDDHDIHVDGTTVVIPSPRGREVSYSGSGVTHYDGEGHEYFRLMLSGAYFVTGRPADAERIFAPVTATPKARAFLACAMTPRPKDGRKNGCQWAGEATVKYLLLDQALHAPDADPYPIAETFYSAKTADQIAMDGAIWADLTCRVFAEPQYAALCDRERRGTVFMIRDSEEPSPVWDAAFVEALRKVVPDIDTRRAHLQTALRDAVVRFGTNGLKSRHDDEGPLPSQFAQAPLPQNFRDAPASNDNGCDGKFAKLPQGFFLVRCARDDARVVVIALSQAYDPSGDPSGGGYWVFLSDDDGKSWRAPLYTGLAVAFPYVVRPSSGLPLIDGDALNVAVDIEEIDPASPYSAPVKREERDLYLRIPLALLARDRDGDGLTDIAEEHLLLDPGNPDTDGDGIADGIDPMPNVKHSAASSPEQLLMQRLLEQIYSDPWGVRPKPENASAVQHAPNADLARGGWPIFIAGNPADFSAFSPDRMMLVYSEADLVKLRRMTPLFRASLFGKAIFNRARDRGYIQYTRGGAGGTLGFRLVKGSWVLEQLSHWIS